MNSARHTASHDAVQCLRAESTRERSAMWRKKSDPMRSLEDTLKQCYPKYTPEEIKRLAKLVVMAIAKATLAGEVITFIDSDEFGTVSLEALFISDESNLS
jgi:hypothetical protein